MRSPRSAAALLGCLVTLLSPAAHAEWDQNQPMGEGQAKYRFDASLPTPAVRWTAAAGYGNHGPTSRLGLEVDQWLRPNVALFGRFVAGPDLSLDPQIASQVRSTFQMGALYKAKESGSRSFVVGAGLGLELGLWIGDAEPADAARVAARIPPDPNANDWSDLPDCYYAACEWVELPNALKTNTALTAGWLVRDDARERSFMLRAEALGLTGYALTLNVGMGGVVKP